MQVPVATSLGSPKPTPRPEPPPCYHPTMSEDPPEDYLHAVGDWSMEETGVIAETSIFSLRGRHCVSPVDSDRRGEFVYLESPDWVNVIALTDDERVVMIEQFRHGIGAVTLEIPGGSVEESEEPVGAGLRELLEESGWSRGEAELIGEVTPNPAIMDNRCYTLLVRNAVRLQDPQPDQTEEIAVRLVPLADVESLIRAGLIHHALVVAAFHHLALLSA